MKFRFFLAVLFFLPLGFSCSEKLPETSGTAEQAASETITVSSPNNSLKVSIYEKEGQIKYQLERKGETVLLESDLGIAFDTEQYINQVSIAQTSPVVAIDENYALLNGKKSEIHYQANEKRILVSNGDAKNLAIVFRVSNDGFAFRYELNNKEIRNFTEEASSFHFASDASSWLQPMAVAKSGWSRTNPSYEEIYQNNLPVGRESTLGAGWVYPALFKTGKTWVLLSESAVTSDWHASHLAHLSTDGNYKVQGPQKEEVIMGGSLYANGIELKSPWRFAAVGDLKTVMESTLGTDLAKPAIDIDMSFIKPGHASWSWAILKDDNTVYDVQKTFIDYAEAMQWNYTLIDADWDRKIGEEKIQELVDYAALKGIGILLWYNSAGEWNDAPYTPRDALLTEEKREATFSKLNKMGVKGVKVDFFGGDGQSVMQYYIDIMTAAAKHNLLVNFHGATLPRGWQRTFPNLMTMESIRGFEFRTFTQENEDRILAHTLTSLYTRNVFDPMDYTPMVFDEIPNIKRVTSNSFELAQAVLMQSGIQHFVEIPKGMKAVPDYVQNFLKTLPTQWDDVRFIDGVPGEWIVLARKAGEQWYVGGMNASEKDLTLNLDLSFIENDKAQIIQQGENARALVLDSLSLSESTNLGMEANSGFVVY